MISGCDLFGPTETDRVAVTVGTPDLEVGDSLSDTTAANNPSRIEIGESLSVRVPGESTAQDTVRLTFHADSGSTLVFLVAGGFFRASVRSEQGIEQVVHSGRRIGLDDSVAFPCLTSGNFTLVVVGAGRSRATISSRVVAGLPEWRILPDRYEFDDSVSAAKPIGPDSVWQDRTIDGDAYDLNDPNPDVDWISIQVDSGTTYRIELQSDPPGPLLSIVAQDSVPQDFSGDIVFGQDPPLEVFRLEVVKSRILHLGVRGTRATSYRIAVTARPGISPRLVPDVFESDNSPSSAKFIPTDGTWQDRSLHVQDRGFSTTDVDWIAMKVDSGRTYTARFTYDSDFPEFALFGADSSPRPFVTGPADAGGLGMYLRTFEVPRSGTWYIRMGGSHSTGYRLAVSSQAGISAGAVQDRYEPDENLASAKPILLGGSPQLRTIHLEDGSFPNPDILSFVADSGRTYRLRYSDSLHVVSAIALGSDSLPLLSKDSTDGIYHYLVIPCSRSGTIYAGFRAVHGYFANYTVFLGSSNGLPDWGIQDRGEPDSGLSSAADMPADSTAFDRVLSGNDTDWIRVRVLKGKVYTIHSSLLAPSGAIDLALLDPSGSALGGITVYGGEGVTLYHEPLADGFLYLRASQLPNSAAVAIPYALRVFSTTLPVDPLEPDDARATSSVLSPDQPPVARFVRFPEEDWMRIVVDSGRAVEIHLTTPSSNGDNLLFQLFSRDSIVVDFAYAHPRGGTTVLRSAPVRADTLFLRVSTMWRVGQVYTVQVVSTPVGDSSAVLTTTSGRMFSAALPAPVGVHESRRGPTTDRPLEIARGKARESPPANPTTSFRCGPAGRVVRARTGRRGYGRGPSIARWTRGEREARFPSRRIARRRLGRVRTR